MPGRFPSVDVKIEIHDGNTEVRLRILDNGVGFSPYSDRRQWAIEHNVDCASLEQISRQ